MRCVFLSLVLCGAPAFCQPTATDEIQRYAHEGDTALAAGRYGEAEAAFEKLRQISPQMAEVHAKLGVIYFQRAKFAEAASALRQAIRLKPGLPNADILLAMSLSELGQYREALPGLQKGFLQSADPAMKRMAGLQLERSYTGLQQDDKAVEVALQLSRLYPEDPEVLYHTGRLFGNFAYLSMRKLSQVAPTSIWRYQAAGEAYESEGNSELAAAAYRQVLALDPRHPGIHYRLGRVLLSAKGEAREQASREFEQELRLDPTNANAAYELAEIQRKAGDLIKAQELFELALKHYPEFEEAHLGLGRVLLSVNKPADGIAHIQKAISLNPDNEVSFFHLSQGYKALGNTAEQQKALGEYKRLQARRAGQERTALNAASSRREATRQELDPDAVN